MNLNLRKALIFAAVLFCFSCTPYKDVPYFQDLNQTAITKQEITNYSALLIQPGDILGISVSTPNPEASAIFNYNLNRVNGDNTDRSPQNAVIGFLVDAEGNIKLPLIGQVKVAGFSTSELNNQLEFKLKEYLGKANINTRILNFKISVMGDVLKPDVYNITNERVTITEALAMAGDLNVTGIRKNILLIREIDGKREFVPIDLTSKKLFESPYYYLKNNDVIYVTPNKQRVASSNSGFQKAELVIAALSVVAILISSKTIKF